MTSLIFVTILILSLVFSVPPQEDQIHRADNLFAGRDNIENLKQAVSLVEDLRVHNPSNYEALWRLAKYKYYVADREKDQANKFKLFEAGIEVAKKAVQLNDKRPEGHFWLGANYGEYADLKGGFTSLGLIKTIRKEFEAVLKIDPTYENGAAYLALGEMDLSLPGLLGGSERRGFEMLENGLIVGPSNSELKLALAERYAKNGNKDEARKLLESVLRVNDLLRTAAEQEELRSEARSQLAKLK
jgi:tetratricopeptide (TPR) repeat protein